MRNPDTTLIVRTRLLVCTLAIGALASAKPAKTQTLPPVPASAACIELNRKALRQIAAGQLSSAIGELSLAFSTGDDRSEQCESLLLQNMANILYLSGRFAEAEHFSERSIATLEQIYPSSDRALLRPLELRVSISLRRGMLAEADRALKKMQLIHTDRDEDLALIHDSTATVFQAEHRSKEAEEEYQRAIVCFEKSKAAQPEDRQLLFNSLGDLYLKQNRFDEARTMYIRALTISDSSETLAPRERIRILNSLALLSARQGQWLRAEDELRSAVAAVDSVSPMGSTDTGDLLANYAFILRKNHHGGVARNTEARIAALKLHPATNSVVDISELSLNPKIKKSPN